MMIEILAVVLPVVSTLIGAHIYQMRQINLRLDQLDLAICKLMSEQEIRQLIDDKLEPVRVHSSNLNKSLDSLSSLLIKACNYKAH